jgi:cyclophilin family peptidyl-prolyl cis-trans isomerase
VFVCAVLTLGAQEKPAAPAPLPDGLYAEFTTPQGAFVAELHYKKTPLTVTSFVGLAEGTLASKDGRPFYRGLRWYRVVPGFVIQSGDPTNPGGGIQSRGPRTPEDEKAGHPYQFPDEIAPGLRHDGAGLLSMANAGPDTNSSEFFVTLADTTRLNYLHSVFGRVVRGGELLAGIKPDDTFSIKILRLGAEARAFRADQAAFDALLTKAAPYTGAAEPGSATHFDDPAKILPQEVPRAKNFNFKLANFQRFTGQRVYARVYPALPQPAEGEKTTPAKFAQKLARELGIHRNGALALHTADTGEWYVWIGDDLMPMFNPEKLKTHERKKQLYEKVRALAAKYTEEARAARGPERPLTPADLVKYSADAMLDELIFLFEPASR